MVSKDLQSTLFCCLLMST